MGQSLQQQLQCCYCCSHNQFSEVSIILASALKFADGLFEYEHEHEHDNGL